MTVKLGIDVLVEDDGKLLTGLKYGLVTNPTGVNRQLIPTHELLGECSAGELVALFGPEHGLFGDVQDELAVESSTDSSTALKIYSLYGETRRKPTAEMVQGLDALVFDIQDIGVRFYTYISTLYYCLEACAEHKLKMIVLDRPNPLGGVKVEGTMLEPKFRSFLGIAPIPTRHGMTAGELALLFNEEIGAELEVVRLQGWKRSFWHDETGLPWVLPSPNIPTLDTVIVYPGTCLVEGTNLSEGRGTTKPFEMFGAPWFKGGKSAKQLNALNLPGVRFRSCYFGPTYGKHLNVTCEGVQVHIENRDLVEPVELGLEIISHLMREYPAEFDWRHDPGDGAGDSPFIDWLLGTDRIRQELEQGIAPQQIIKTELPQIQTFAKLREKYLLY